MERAPKSLLAIASVLFLIACNSSTIAPQASGSGAVSQPTTGASGQATTSPGGGSPGATSVASSEGTGPASSQSATPDTRPNIVVIMIDDIAQMDDRIWDRMPTIKSMFLDQGITFTNYLGNDPLCCPGRANFLTGQVAHHHGVIRNDARLFDPRESIATELQGAGYWTAIDGKYFNGTKLLSNFTPPGWDQTLIYGGGYFGSQLWINGTEIQEPKSVYTTDVVAKQATTILNSAPANKPLFLLLTPYAVHANGLKSKYMPAPPPRYVGDPRCAGIGVWKPPNYMEANVSDKPAYIRRLPTNLYPKGWPLKKVCETMLTVDDLVKQVKAQMDALGRTNTLYVLTDDNGMTFGAHRWPTKSVPYATPMPLFVRWPGTLGSGVRNATISNIDFAPTFCAIAGCQMGPYPDGYPVDGMSFLPVLMGTQPTLNRLYVEVESPAQQSGSEAVAPVKTEGTPAEYTTTAWYGVRTTDSNPMGPWEYTEYTQTGECELYDLKADPWELRNRCNKPAYAAQQKVLAGYLAQARSK